jgi:hypothetical protein
MAFNYTRSELLSDINAGLRGKIGMISSQEDFVNRVVREVKNAIALRSARRKATLSPDLFPGVTQYACPSDLQDNRIIDIPAQVKRYDGSFGLVPVEQFNVSPRTGDIAIDDYNGARVLLINSEVETASSVISTLETTTSGGGTWVAVGDAENVRDNGDDYMKGSGSVFFDIGAGGTTTAGIENTGLDTSDITEFLGGHSSVFVWVRINSTTNLTNFILKLGTDSTNYYSKTVTARHDGNAFQSGWNLLRFPLTSLTETGTVTDTSIGYAALYMTKTAGKISETDYGFNYLVIMKGVIHDILYYSKYGWQNNTGTYLENSTDDSDVVVADTTEYELFVKHGVSRGMRLTNSAREDIDDADKEFADAVSIYNAQNPDESQLMVSTYHYYGNSAG